MRAVALAGAAAIWAVCFCRAHAGLVFALSEIPAVKRSIVILGGNDLSPFAVGVKEAVTGPARALPLLALDPL